MRGNWRATIFLVLLAGLAGGVAIGAWSAERRTENAFERMLARAGLPDLNVTFCPPDMTAADVDGETIVRCWDFDAHDEVAAIRRIPAVAAAGRGAYKGLTMALPSDPAQTWVVGGLFARDLDIPNVDGNPMVVEGRMYAPDAPDEIVVNETVVERTGVGVGDELVLTFQNADERGRLAADGARFHGPEARVRIVGVVRGVRDVAARTGGADNLLIDDAYVLGGPGLWAVVPDAKGFAGILVRGHDGDGAALLAAIEEAFGDRPFNASPVQEPDQLEPVDQAIGYEARGVTAFALLAALAGALFGGQAVARQTRRESADLPTMYAIGLSRGQAAITAALRGLAIGIGAAVVAVIVAVALSPLGPIGIARTTEVESTVHADPLVLLVGAALVVAVVTMAAWFPVGRRAGGRMGRRGRSPRPLLVPRTSLPPPASTGVGMALNGGRSGHGLPLGTAFASLALAAGALVAAACLLASLTALTDQPARYGANWDLSFGEQAPGSAATYLQEASGVESAAGIRGADIEIDGHVYWAQAFEPVPGIDRVVEPPIAAGRAPARDDEIALGAVTMRELGVGIGDRVEVRTTVSSSTASTMTVVGTALINDTYEGSPGLGAIVTPNRIAEISPESTVDPYVLRLAPGTDREAFVAELGEAFPASVSGPVKQIAVRNVERIRALPALIAGLIALLAVASMTHALVLSVRGNRRHLAVLKALGFTRGQTGATVGWQASTLAVVAVVLGVPLGLAAGRWGWRLVADQLGVASGAVVPVMVMVVAVVGAVLWANLAALVPALRAARLRPAEALRTE
jgi:ABC-type lipoprotein release transport system permease subunit